MGGYLHKNSAEKLIPQKVQDFAADFVALAKKHKLHDASVTLRLDRFVPEDQPRWDTPITISWEQGRHGEDANQYRIQTQLNIWIDSKHSYALALQSEERDTNG